MFRHILAALVALLLWPFSNPTFTIVSYDFEGVEVKIGTAGWRQLKPNELKTIVLHKTDLVKVHMGKVQIAKTKDLKDIRVAYPGTWTVEQIWKGQAKSRTSNLVPIGDVTKGREISVSLGFKTEGSERVGLVLNPNAKLTQVVISNDSDQNLYTRVCWKDQAVDSLFVIHVQDNHALAGSTTTTFNLNPELQLDGSTDPSTVYLFYSTNPIQELDLPRVLTEKDMVTALAKRGIQCAKGEIEYRNE